MASGLEESLSTKLGPSLHSSLRVSCRNGPATMESGVSLEAAPLFLQGRGKAVYILPS
ncbi:hypothetical protein HanIR_Chr02g0084251 [Helianthus annuus]|nr:hypothetical protein HanIR_Chr02g0084251 [Helianthus annuus]